jgi:hypothetical protein
VAATTQVRLLVRTFGNACVRKICVIAMHNLGQVNTPGQDRTGDLQRVRLTS